MQVNVKVFHNDDSRFSRGYESGDTITLVHETEVEAPMSKSATIDTLEDLYRRYNIGGTGEEYDDFMAYRGVKRVGNSQVCDGSGKAVFAHGNWYGIRSLSVGDVIVIGESAFTVAMCGWEPVSLVLEVA